MGWGGARKVEEGVGWGGELQGRWRRTTCRGGGERDEEGEEGGEVGGSGGGGGWGGGGGGELVLRVPNPLVKPFSPSLFAT